MSVIQNRFKGKRRIRSVCRAIILMGVVLASLHTVFPQNDRRIRATVLSEPNLDRPGRSPNSPAAYLKVNYLCPVETDPVARRVFLEYGSILAASDEVVQPDRCIYESDEALAKFRDRLKIDSANIGRTRIELQAAALAALIQAREVAAGQNRRITPLDGAVAGGRTLDETVRLWNSRFYPALDRWVRKGKIAGEDADAARAAPWIVQVRRVIEWEKAGLNFGTGLASSIFSSVAPPGASQHLFLLAFDVAEYSDPVVVSALNRNGWFQTIVNDPPHFTYLGAAEAELPARGLRLVYRGRHKYWVPNAAPVKARNGIDPGNH